MGYFQLDAVALEGDREPVKDREAVAISPLGRLPSVRAILPPPSGVAAKFVRSVCLPLLLFFRICFVV